MSRTFTNWTAYNPHFMHALDQRRAIERRIRGMSTPQLLDLTIHCRESNYWTLYEPYPTTRAHKVAFCIREVERHFMPHLVAAREADVALRVKREGLDSVVKEAARQTTRP